MNKRGFTLIELLAVIVILAIIALIAVPIVINIIDDSKKNASLRSADFYLSAVENSIAQSTLKGQNIKAGTYNIMKDGNICLEDYNSTSKKCVDSSDEGTDIDILEVEVNGEYPKQGTITITNGVIKNVDISIDEKRITKNDKGEIIYFPCTLISGEANTIGSKYECEVSPGIKYNFYVLSHEDNGTTNLIMDRNIYYDATAGTGSVADATNKGLVKWQTSGTTADGPITAMDYLYNATKDWTNILNIEMNYTDEGNGYRTIVTTDNITKITKKYETAVTVLTDKEGYSNLKARLPRYDEVHGEGKCLTYSENGNKNGSCPLWLSNYLNSNSYVTGEGLQNISGIYGYWTLSSVADSSYSAWYVNCYGSVGSTLVDVGDTYGVRAVINLKI